jgi:lipoprotein-releasing system permease protein
VQVGDCVQMVIPFGRPGQLQPVALPFEVIGLFEMGFHQHDTHLAYVALEDLRQLETARPFIYGLELVFADPLSVGKMMDVVEARIGTGYHVLDWRMLSQGLFSALEAQRVLIGLFILIIIVVSAFNLVASLIIIVLTKTREIAILGALGARPAAVLRVFVQSGGVAGLLGTGTGLAAGAAICALLRAYHFRLDAAVYMIPELPIDLNPADFALVGGVAQLACLLATIFPVLRARRLAIADGLRQV